MEYSLLKDVNMLSQQWTVRVRLTRFTEFMNTDKPPRLSRIDLVLLDEQGTTMEGQVPENRIPFFRAHVKEDCVYDISFFQVCDARMKYRPVNHQYMMRFTQHTVLSEFTPVPPNFPKYACDIVTYDVLRSRAGKREFCSDAIGLFTGCSHIRAQSTRNGVKPLREVYLTDGREDIVVTLWEQHAERFDGDQYINMGAERPLVILFVGVTCLLFNDKLSLQSASSCRWYVDPQIPQTEEIKISCGTKAAVPAWAKKNLAQSSPEKISVYQLAKFTNPHVIFNNRYVVDVKIKALLPGRPWWYPACKTCRKGTIPDGEGVICKNRNCTSTTASPRYRLALLAEDPAPPKTDHAQAEIELVIFGPKAQELIGLPVDSLMTQNITDENYVPAQITNLYGRCFELSISVSPYSLQNPTIIYQVDAIMGTASQIAASESSKSNVTNMENAVAVRPPAQSVAGENPVILPAASSEIRPQFMDDQLRRAYNSSETDATLAIPQKVDPPQLIEKDENDPSVHYSGDVNPQAQGVTIASATDIDGKASAGHVVIQEAETQEQEQPLVDDHLLDTQKPKESESTDAQEQMTPPKAVLQSHEVSESTTRGRKRRAPQEPKDASNTSRDETPTKERSSKRRLEFSAQETK